MSLAQRLTDEITANGPLTFDRWMEQCLYDPSDGFYTATGMAGRRRGDFITSPEVGPLFGAVVARALDVWWVDAGSPGQFVVAEAAAGLGTLARSVLAAAPACGSALQWIAVETSPTLRAEHGDLLAAGHDSAAELPDKAHIIIANELLDNLPVRLVQRRSDHWMEIAVSLDASGGFVPVLQAVPDALPAALVEAAESIPDGIVMPIAEAASTWVTTAATACGRLVVFDYGPPQTDDPTQLPVRTYRGHVRGDDPFAAPGSADITCDVPFSQLPRPTTSTTQANWLRDHGIESLVEEGHAIWQERAAIGDLAAIAARSRAVEAQALLAPDGLGGFSVLEWA